MTVATEIREQTRARYPDAEGFVERDGVRVFWELYGDGEPTILLLPTWSIIHSRVWKVQIPYLARTAACSPSTGAATVAPTGRTSAEAYAEREFAADALAVMDATETERAVVVGFSMRRAVGRCCSPPTIPSGSTARSSSARAAPSAQPAPRWRTRRSTSGSRPTRAGPSTTATTGSSDYRDFLEFFFGEVLHRAALDQADRGLRRLGPRDRRPRRWLTYSAPASRRRRSARALCRRVRCPVLVIHGDRRRDHARATRGAALRRATGGALVAARGLRPRPARARPGAGQPPPARLRRLAAGSRRAAGRAAAAGASARSTSPRRSGSGTPGATSRSPASCAQLAPRPRDRLARAAPGHRGARGARASASIRRAAQLANESHHIESESAEHDLHCFQAWRRMDEILLANFMVFHDVVREEHYDLWIGDEALGARLLPAREPRAEARRLRLADRLRRLAADARRRRARGRS